MAFKGKIINDPIYGFISLRHPLVLQVISHPYYQRLRRIYQMAFAHLVYPGAVHTRMAHSLGAYHLMQQALEELQRKGVDITEEESTAACIAILLHDIGHGPFSHALEGRLVPGVSHERLGFAMMHALNRDMGGQLQMAIDIFSNQYPKRFLHQLVSGQLDVDRMDYLIRDSFYTGVSEGVIGYDRILKMLVVEDDELMVEEKAIYSIEKFLVARRLMYWQVYLHKTVLAAEQMLVRLIARACQVGATAHGPLTFFLQSPDSAADDAAILHHFVQIDDMDLMVAMKQWQQHPDKVLAVLSDALVNRNLFKLRLQATPVDDEEHAAAVNKLAARLGLSEADAGYLAFTGKVSTTTYRPGEERIRIRYKDGTVRDISQVDHALIQHGLAAAADKYYICRMAAP